MNYSYSNNKINSANVSVKLENIVDNVEFWVSPDGSDENGEGTVNNAFKSISHAVSEATKRSRNVVIHICPGIYEGALNRQLTLSAMNNISLVGMGIDETIIDGENDSYFAIVTEGLNRVEISNLTIKNYQLY